MELLNEIMKIVIYFVITGCGVTIVKKTVDWINIQIDEAQINTQLAKFEKINVIIDKVQSVVTTVVEATNQTFVFALKKEGKFDAESATKAKEMAMETAKKLLSDEAVNAIEAVYGDVTTYVDSLIEQIVLQLKVESEWK